MLLEISLKKNEIDAHGAAAISNGDLACLTCSNGCVLSVGLLSIQSSLNFKNINE